MKRTLLLGTFGLAALWAGAQCVPNPIYQDSLFGAWPDTAENFLPGTVGLVYSDTLFILVPENAGDIDPTYEGLMLDSVVFNGISGLPPGISVQCNSQTSAPCTFLTGQVGCGLLSGLPTTAGTFDMVLNVIGYTNFLGAPIPFEYGFPGYSITIAPGNVGVSEVGPALGKVQNVPNPFANRTQIEFSVSKATLARVKVFNLVGEELWSEAVEARPGVNKVPFDASRMGSGVYLYKVEANGLVFTGRMVVNR
ncbi:MAG TPA: T9SS type A sorting domain-containing protein [Flavobacteriales bacterium]